MSGVSELVSCIGASNTVRVDLPFWTGCLSSDSIADSESVLEVPAALFAALFALVEASADIASAYDLLDRSIGSMYSPDNNRTI